MLISLIVILTIYCLFGLFQDQSKLKSKTKQTRFSLGLASTFRNIWPSQRGFTLLTQLLELRMEGRFFGTKELVPYKKFDDFFIEMAMQMQKLGAFNDIAFQSFIAILKKDLDFQKKLEQIFSKGFSQLLGITLISVGFIFYSSKILNEPFPQMTIISILLVTAFGIVLFAFIFSKFTQWRFNEIDQLIQSVLLLKAYSQLNLSMQKSIDLAHIDKLIRNNFKNSKTERLFVWLIDLIDKWKSHGQDIEEGLEHFIDQCITQRELIQENTKLQYQFLIFFFTCCFGLLPFLVGVYRIIGSYLAKAF